jgi:hypothetical protein
MLKSEAILATFDTLDLEERRKLLKELISRSDLYLNTYDKEDMNGNYENDEKDENLSDEEKFIQFVYRINTSKIFIKKEDVKSCFILFEHFKEKCNFGYYKKYENEEGKLMYDFYIAYDSERTVWSGSKMSIYKSEQTLDKEDFFQRLINYADKLWVCSENKNINVKRIFYRFNYRLFHIFEDKDILNEYVKGWEIAENVFYIGSKT